MHAGGKIAVRPGESAVLHFFLCTEFEGHEPFEIAEVAVRSIEPDLLMLSFENGDHCLGDATVLACGSVGAAALREAGYTGPVPERPRLAVA